MARGIQGLAYSCAKMQSALRGSRDAVCATSCATYCLLRSCHLLRTRRSRSFIRRLYGAHRRRVDRAGARGSPVRQPSREGPAVSVTLVARDPRASATNAWGIRHMGGWLRRSATNPRRSATNPGGTVGLLELGCAHSASATVGACGDGVQRRSVRAARVPSRRLPRAGALSRGRRALSRGSRPPPPPARAWRASRRGVPAVRSPRSLGSPAG